MKGGLLIDASAGHQCTSGFMARPNDLEDDRLFVLTAGHCLDPVFGSGLAATWTHPSSPVTALGTGQQERLYSGTNADAGVINDSEPEGRNFLFASSKDDVRQIASRETNADQGLGDFVCRQGRVTGYECGTITAVNQTIVVQGVTLNHMWRFSEPSIGGDSGGPLFLATTAYGIMSTTTSYYSTIEWISAELFVRPCYSTSCGL